MNLYVVAIYSEDRAYGGPEEGGWWYTEGELVTCDSAWTNEDVAWERVRELNEELHGLTDDVRYHGRSYPRETATVVELGREEVLPELQDYVCHGDTDDLWDEHGRVKPEYRVVRWDIPQYYPERRPHYC